MSSESLGKHNGLLRFLKERYQHEQRLDTFNRIIGNGLLWIILTQALTKVDWRHSFRQIDVALILRELSCERSLFSCLNKEQFKVLLMKLRTDDPTKNIFKQSENAKNQLEKLEEVIKKLAIEPKKLLRKNEQVYKDLIKENGEPNNKTAIKWMVENPILIERPIVLSDKKAVIARPPELAKGFI